MPSPGEAKVVGWVGSRFLKPLPTRCYALESVPAEVYERLQKRAAARRRSLSEEMLHWLQQVLRQDDSPNPGCRNSSQRGGFGLLRPAAVESRRACR